MKYKNNFQCASSDFDFTIMDLPEKYSFDKIPTYSSISHEFISGK